MSSIAPMPLGKSSATVLATLAFLVGVGGFGLRTGSAQEKSTDAIGEVRCQRFRDKATAQPNQ